MADTYDDRMRYGTEEADAWAITASFPDDVYMLGGDDYVTIQKNGVSVYGGAGNDTLQIETENVFVDGQEGNDIVFLTPALQKNSTITTGTGEDIIYLRPIFSNRLSGQNVNTAVVTDFSSDDVIVIYDTDYSEEEHAIVSGKLVDGNLVISDNVSLGSGTEFEQLVRLDNGLDTEPSYTEINPTFSITLQGVTSLDQVNYWQGYQEFDGPTIYSVHSATAVIPSTSSLTKNGNTYTYSGGDKVIENYQQDEVVALTSDYQGIDLNGNSFFVNSSSGHLEIQNARDKFIGYSAGDENVIAYSYVASGGGNVDGRGKSQAEIMIGGDNSNNQIFAGNGGSSLWGGNGGADTLVGGDGYDEFFFAIGSGGDVIQNAGSNDVVNLLGVSLEQIAGVYVSSEQIHIDFTSGEFLQVKGTTNVGYRLQGATYVCNQSTGEWSTK